MEVGSRRMQYVATLSETLVYITAGTVMGWSAPMTQRLLTDGYINSDQESWLASVNNLAVVAGNFAVSPLVNSAMGRKWSLVGSALPLAVSWVMMGASTDAGVLIAARCVAGVGYGVATSVGPMYLAEVAEPAVRGLITTFLQVTQNLGMLYIYCVGPYLPYWGVSVACIVFPLLFTATFSWMPETPYHLLSKGRRKEAISSLLKIRGKKDPSGVEEELQSMERAVSEQRVHRRSLPQELRQLFTQARHLRGLLVACGLFFFQIGSGMVSVTSYATSIFSRVDAGLDPDLSVIVLAAVQIVVNLAASLTVDRLGRRPLMVTSFLGCAATIAAVGAYFYLQNVAQADVSALGWLPLTALVLYFISYSFGAGPLPWMMMGEVFSPEVKGTAISVVGVFLGLLLFAFVKVFPLVVDALGEHVTFWAEGVLSVGGALFVFFVVPETKGKTLQQITEELAREPSHNEKVEKDLS